MAMYRCEECENIIDGDYSPCVEHPKDPTAYCCESCADSLEMDISSTNQQEKSK